MGASEGLSELEMLVLRALHHSRSLEELAKAAKAPPATIGKTIAKLQLGGYIGESGRLTEKGTKAISD